MSVGRGDITPPPPPKGIPKEGGPQPSLFGRSRMGGFQGGRKIETSFPLEWRSLDTFFRQGKKVSRRRQKRKKKNKTKDRLSPVFPFSQIHFFIPPCRGPERQRHTARVDEHAQGCGNQKNRPPKRVACLAGAERLELSTRGFGDRCSTN